MYLRTETKTIFVGNLPIGGNNHVYVQSMTTTKTKDIDATIEQIKRLENVGCELVRVAIRDHDDAAAVAVIKQNISIPLIAGIHFDYRLALEAIENNIDKIRINPGNIGSSENIRKVVEACGKKGVPIRIGINSGSLEKDLLETYKDRKAEAMVESAKRQVALLEQLGFTAIFLSLKSSDLATTVRANQLAAEIFRYPLHLGITEAGTAFSGAIRSAIGLGIMLGKGIGATIRVSLTADPVDEIKAGKEILSDLSLYDMPILISCPTCGRIQYDMFPIANAIEDYLQTVHKKIKVAIMGCAVNGPGEAKDANVAICGGKDEALLFIDGVQVKKIPQSDLIPELKKAIALYKEKK